MSVKKRDKSWVADVMIGGRTGKRIRRTFPTRALAIAFERDIKVREIQGDLNITKPTPIALKDFIGKYLNLHEAGNRASTRQRDEYALRRFNDFFDEPQLTEISRESIERYKAFRQEQVKPATVNLELRVVKSLFNRAKEWGYLNRLPTAGIKMIRLDQKEPRFLSPSEGRRLIDSARGQTTTFITLAMNTGLRKSELMNMTWDHICFDRNELRVPTAKGRKYRVIPLNTHVISCLTNHPRHITSAFVLYHEDGSQRRDFRNSFNAALKRAGLPHIRIHDLRHTFISNLVASGVDLRAVKELAGHANISTTMKYAHLAPGRLAESVERLQWV